MSNFGRKSFRYHKIITTENDIIEKFSASKYLCVAKSIEDLKTVALREKDFEIFWTLHRRKILAFLCYSNFRKEYTSEIKSEKKLACRYWKKCFRKLNWNF